MPSGYAAMIRAYGVLMDEDKIDKKNQKII
jgi:hypothetical protein